MATRFPPDPHIEAVYVNADSPAELFTAAAQWAAEHDGGFTIQAITWKDLAPRDEHRYEIAIYYEPHGG